MAEMVQVVAMLNLFLQSHLPKTSLYELVPVALAQLVADRVAMVEATLQCLGAERFYYKLAVAVVVVVPKERARVMVAMVVQEVAQAVSPVQTEVTQTVGVVEHKARQQQGATAVLQVQMALQVQQA